MAARDQLTWEENLVAAIGGSGIFLAILGGLLMGFGEGSDLTSLFATVGVMLVVVSASIWMVLLQPWKKFDDLKTAYYTGHHHDHHDDHAHDVAHAVADEHFAETGGGQHPVEALVAPPVVEAVVAEAEAPIVATPAPVAEPDDLKLIEGVGPKTEEALNALGISTFAQIGAMNAAELEEKVKAQGVRLVGSTSTWVSQAKLLAAGELTELDELKKRIKGGYLYDELTLIEGIGEKAQEALYEAKYRSFDDIAAAGPDELKQALEAAGLSMSPETWPKQAQFIVADDLSGLKAYQDSLKH
ncbi:MAG: hypothetical protein H6673_03140 [Anaerolineales bacterium]|nr:hypothetical protein [Anaerolineales bacterium]